MVRTDADGNQIWKKRFGNNTQQSLNAVCEALDGSFVGTGYSNNYDDLYIVKRNREGDQEWEKIIDYSENDDWDTDQGNDIILANDGGFYILGSTNMYPATSGQDDFWLIKTDSDGDTLWTDVIGGEWWDIGQSLIQIENGNLLLLGTTESYTSYPDNQYDTDFWLINYSPDQMNLEDESRDLTGYKLSNAYPNPFNPTTNIRYDLPVEEIVNIAIYDVMGRKIKSLVNTKQVAGYRSITWDATNSFGEQVSAGMYIYTIQAGEFRQTKKMVLLK